MWCQVKRRCLGGIFRCSLDVRLTGRLFFEPESVALVWWSWCRMRVP